MKLCYFQYNEEKRWGAVKADLVFPLENLDNLIEESNRIKLTEYIKIENVKLLVSPYIKNQGLFEDLCGYFDNQELRPYKYLGTFSRPLNRADTYLFTLTMLEATPAQLEKMIDQWYALIPSFLLMDDLTDLHEDSEKNEENSVTDFGEGSEGVEKAIGYLRLKSTYLKSVNPQLGEFFERSLDRKLHTPYMQSILNNQYGTR